MKTNIKTRFRNSLAVAVVGLLLVACHTEPEFPEGIKHVVVIGIDGMSVQGLLEANTPCMDSLIQNGAYNYNTSVIKTTTDWNCIMKAQVPGSLWCRRTNYSGKNDNSDHELSI
jgi:hypothetical protein